MSNIIRRIPDSILDIYTVPNPKYYSALKRGTAGHWLKIDIKLNPGGNYPAGAAFWSHKRGTRLNLPEKTTGSISTNLSLSLYDYQEEAVRKMELTRAALIISPTGSGKTIMAMAAIHRLKHKTLIVCHNQVLTKQFKKTVEEVLGVECGIFFSAKKDIQDITVTTYKSFKDNFAMFQRRGFNCLIIDECDMFTTDSCLKCFCAFDCERKYGFTATKRVGKYDENLPYGSIPFLERVWGYTHEIKIDKQKNVLKDIFVKRYDKKYLNEFGLPVLAQEWIKFREILDDDEQRKQAQADFAKENFENGDYCLILVDRVRDVEFMSERLGCYKLHGEMKASDRNRNEDDFKKNGGFMVANRAIASRGWDVPKVNKVFLFCPIKDENSLIQAIGRCIRWIEGKDAFFYDWVDSSLAFQNRSRTKVYKKIYPNAEITDI